MSRDVSWFHHKIANEDRRKCMHPSLPTASWVNLEPLATEKIRLIHPNHLAHIGGGRPMILWLNWAIIAHVHYFFFEDVAYCRTIFTIRVLPLMVLWIQLLLRVVDLCGGEFNFYVMIDSVGAELV
jgi:hypothetical protein